MPIICKSDLDDKIVMFGMSCSGKTTFATNLTCHRYHNFDVYFNWHLIEILGLSIEDNLRYLQTVCQETCYVLDGWHLCDKEGMFLPIESKVYVIYAPYEQIVAQYRVPVIDPEEHRAMFNKWYKEIDYLKLPGTRYFRNTGELFQETNRDQFIATVFR